VIYPIVIDPKAIACIAGMESTPNVSQLLAAAAGKRRLVAPLRMPKRPWRAMMIEDGGDIV